MKRISKLDSMKGLLSVLVILGHVLMFVGGNSWDNKLLVFLCSFHMPLFMAVSGYLFGHSVAKKYWTVITRSMRLLIPIVVWGTIDYLFAIASGIELNELSNLLSHITVGGLWFLYVLIFNQCSIATLWKLRMKYSFRIICMVTLFIVLLIVSEYIQSFRMIAFLYPYFVAGFLYKQYAYRIKSCEKGFCLLNLVSFPIILLYFNESTYIYTTGISLIHSNYSMANQLIINIYRWIIGLSGSIFIYTIYKMWDEPREDSFLCKIGKKSLQFYAIQGVVIVRILAPLISKFRRLRWIAYFMDNEYLNTYVVCPFFTVIICLVLYGIIMLIEKKTIISKIIFGRG